jgi:DNA-binding transcriptional MerR regulator
MGDLSYEKIIRGNGFSEAFYDLDEKMWSDIKKIFETSRFKVNQTGASYRVINSWFEQGIISASQVEDKGWRVFSLVENVWLQIVIILRKFGYSLDKIKQMKDQIFDPKNEFEYKLFLYYLSTPLLRKPIKQVIFLAFLDGTYEIAIEKEIRFSSQAFNTVPDYINININNILQACFEKLDLMPALGDEVELTNDEFSLLLELRNKKYESIELKFKGGKIDMLSGIEIIDSNNHISDILKDHDYQDIEIKKQAGNVVLIRRKVKQKLD